MIVNIPSPYDTAANALLDMLDLPPSMYNISQEMAVRHQQHRRVLMDNTTFIAQAESMVERFEYSREWLTEANDLL